MIEYDETLIFGSSASIGSISVFRFGKIVVIKINNLGFDDYEMTFTNILPSWAIPLNQGCFGMCFTDSSLLQSSSGEFFPQPNGDLKTFVSVKNSSFSGCGIYIAKN